MKIRLMKIEDFNEIYSLWKKAGLNLADYEVERADTKLTIKLNPSSCLVFSHGNQIIGAVLGTFNGIRGWIYHLAIQPNYQNKGLGSLLLEKTEAALKKLGAKRILLGVSINNLEVLEFYAKHNYVQVDDAITLGKDLESKSILKPASIEKGEKYVLYRY